MNRYSPTAWNIASLYRSALASETRDLAAHIDAALKRARKQAAELPLSDKTVSELITLAEDCYEEITRRAMVAINGPPGQVRP
jgi:hypothetical protein